MNSSRRIIFVRVASILLLLVPILILNPVAHTTASAQAYPETTSLDVSTQQGCAVRIMPLGDSNTEGIVGSTYQVGYRRSLWLSLKQLGYDVDFVGGLTTGELDDFDRDHEGHAGWTANLIRDNVNGFLTANPPNIVLLAIGTNDITGGQSPTGIVKEIDEILTNIYSFDSKITVVLAKVINRKGNEEQIARTSELNRLIQDLANARKAAGDKVLVVDLEHALTYPDDMYDNVHPDDNGYEKMAGAWLHVLEDYLPHYCDPGSPSTLLLPVILGTIRSGVNVHFRQMAPSSNRSRYKCTIDHN